MPDNRLTKQMVNGQPQEGRHVQGGQKKSYKDDIKSYRRKCSFNSIEICGVGPWRHRITRTGDPPSKCLLNLPPPGQLFMYAPTTIGLVEHGLASTATWRPTDDQTNRQEANHTHFKWSPMMMGAFTSAQCTTTEQIGVNKWLICYSVNGKSNNSVGKYYNTRITLKNKYIQCFTQVFTLLKFSTFYHLPNTNYFYWGFGFM